VKGQPPSDTCRTIWLALSLLVIAVAPPLAQAHPEAEFPVFQKFERLPGIYEPSGAEQLPDGRIFVVEDEIATSLAILTIQGDGSFDVQRLDPQAMLRNVEEGASPAISDDLEGIAVDDDGLVYVITSHSRETDGAVDPRRERLVRFRVDRDRLTEIEAYADLKRDIAAAYPRLARSTEVIDVKNDGGLNIEAIAFDRDQMMWVGFRSPLAKGRAILVQIRNPKTMFAAGESADVGELVQLDLEKSGVRAMVYDPKLDTFLIIAGPVSRDRSIIFRLWSWSGETDEPARLVTIPGPPAAINRTECVAPVRWNGLEKVLLLRDDGKKKIKKDRPAHYMFLDYDQLEIAPIR